MLDSLVFIFFKPFLFNISLQGCTLFCVGEAHTSKHLRDFLFLAGIDLQKRFNEIC